MILNISLTVIDLNIDSSIILDFLILDLLSFRNFSFVGSPELVDVVEQKGSFWRSLGKLLFLLLLLFILLFLFLLSILLLLFLFFLNITFLFLLLLVLLFLDISWHFGVLLLLLGLGFLGLFLKLFLHSIWLLFNLFRARWLLKLSHWRSTVLSPLWLVVGLWGFLTSPVGNWVNHVVNGNPNIRSHLFVSNIMGVLVINMLVEGGWESDLGSVWDEWLLRSVPVDSINHGVGKTVDFGINSINFLTGNSL